jgi:CopG family nickel-responsive transcriptional regulator
VLILTTSIKGVVRFSVSLPPSLVRDFDEAWKGLGYDNRSKAAHDAFRSFISEFKWTREEAGEIAGAIVLLYYVNKSGLLNEIVRVQHKFENVVSSTMHIHLSKDKCLEIIAVKGKADEIKSLSQELMTKKGVKQLKLTTIAL